MHFIQSNFDVSKVCSDVCLLDSSNIASGCLKLGIRVLANCDLSRNTLKKLNFLKNKKIHSNFVGVYINSSPILCLVSVLDEINSANSKLLSYEAIFFRS